MKRIFIASLVMLFTGCIYLSGQASDQMVAMVKSMIRDFDEIQPEESDNDDIINEAAPFNLDREKPGKNEYLEILKKNQDLFLLENLNGGYTIINDKEIPLNSVDLVFSYYSFPGWQEISGWFEIKKLTDGKGKGMAMSPKLKNKYIEQGIIDEGFNYPVPGQYSETIWLNRELSWEEKLNIQGILSLEYPAEYTVAVFDAGSTGETKKVGDTEFQLLDIKGNMLVYRVKGNRRVIENISIIPLNSEGKPFNYVTSYAIDAEMYDPSTKKLKQMSDEELRTVISKFDLSDEMTDQVKKVSVTGNIAKLAVLKVESKDQLEYDFSISLEAQY